MTDPDGDHSSDAAAAEGPGALARLRRQLGRTRSGLTDGLAGLFGGRAELGEAELEAIEDQLLTADVGVHATERIIDGLKRRLRGVSATDWETVREALAEEMRTLLAPCEPPLSLAEGGRPYVILVVGVNGVGKTTTIGKLGARLQRDGHRVVLAAGDTFRAAAVEQLQIWGERIGAPVIAQHTGADAASVVYDAFDTARARGADVLIADTAGRLHTQDHLMDELAKIGRVLGRLDPDAPHEVLLTLDAGTGQNALSQARQFHAAVAPTGVVLTKLDGTARGGILFALAEELALPLRYVGVGEGVDDLQPFDARAFVDALVGAAR